MPQSKEQGLLNLQLSQSHFGVNTNYECPWNTCGKFPNLEDSMGHGKKALLAEGSINKGLPENSVAFLLSLSLGKQWFTTDEAVMKSLASTSES